MPTENKNADLTALEQKVMLVIMRQYPDAYGISILDRLEQDTHRSFSIGSIYAALERLEDKGFIKSREGEATAERGGKKKLHFILTGLGETALDEAMNTWDVLRKGIRWKGVTA